MTGLGEVPEEALGDVAYLARSANRMHLLRALVSEPGSARALRDRTDTSKTTCNRILNEFAERSWVRRTPDGDYEATPRAEHVAAQFRPFVDSVATIRDLGDDVGILPPDELAWGPDGDLTLGVHHFADATVLRKIPQQQGVGRSEMRRAFRTTSSIHTIADGAPPRVIGRVLQERADEGRLSGAAVFSAPLFEFLRDHHDGPPDWGDMVQAGVSGYKYDGTTPRNLTVTDEATFVIGEARDGAMGVVISERPVVREWGIDVVERYRDRAEEFDSGAFE